MFPFLFVLILLTGRLLILEFIGRLPMFPVLLMFVFMLVFMLLELMLVFRFEVL